MAAPEPQPPAVDVWQRTSMAAERTWLAWWRTALAATAGALAIGRLAPEVLDTAPWPYIVLGCGYAGLAIALLVFGALRQRGSSAPSSRASMSRSRSGSSRASRSRGVLLAVFTVVLVGAQL